MIIENTLLTASQICTLFILMGVGALCRRLNILTDKAVESLVKLLVNIVTPALIIDAFQCPFQSELLGDLAITAAISAIFHILLILLCTALFPGRDDSNPVIRMASVFSNAGFMGLPLEYAILGKAGVFFGSVKPAIIAKSAAFYFAAAIRLVLSPLLMIGLICITRPFINIGRPASIALVIAAAAPVAALVAVLSAKYKKNMPLATGLVSGTTLLSIVTLPPAVAAAMYIFK
jgi:predicted permease